MLTFDVLPEEVQKLTTEVRELKALIQNFQFPKIEEPSDTLTLSELASRLKVSLVTIHKYKRKGILPYYQVGGIIYFKTNEVDAALASYKKKKC